MRDKRAILLWAVGALAVYVAAYFLLMARDVASVNKTTLKREFRSCSRFGPKESFVDGITITTSTTCTLNYIFYPADLVYYSIADGFRGHKP